MSGMTGDWQVLTLSKGVNQMPAFAAHDNVVGQNPTLRIRCPLAHCTLLFVILHAFCAVLMSKQADNHQDHRCTMVPLTVYHLNCCPENLQPCTTQARCLSETQPLAPSRCSSQKRGVQSTDLSATAYTPSRAQAASPLLHIHTALRPSRTVAVSSFLAFVDVTESFETRTELWLACWQPRRLVTVLSTQRSPSHSCPGPRYAQ